MRGWQTRERSAWDGSTTCTSACRPAEAAAWYAEHLGFEPVEEYDFWANGVDQGPLQISADGGSDDAGAVRGQRGRTRWSRRSTGSPSASTRTASCPSPGRCPGTSTTRWAEPLAPDVVIDFDLCWAFDLVDPWGNQYELNCYEYDDPSELVGPDAITAVRYWPRDVYDSTPGAAECRKPAAPERATVPQPSRRTLDDALAKLRGRRGLDSRFR